MADYTRIRVVVVCSKQEEDNDASNPGGISKSFSASRRAGEAAQAADASPEPTRNAFLIGKCRRADGKRKVLARHPDAGRNIRCWVVKYSKTEHVLLCLERVCPPACSD